MLSLKLIHSHSIVGSYALERGLNLTGLEDLSGLVTVTTSLNY